MFNNCNSRTNGEQMFFLKIKDSIKVIFDVGCRTDTEYSKFVGEVHYFDPVEDFITRLSKMPNNNSLSFFNAFGLGSENEEKYYYPIVKSFNVRSLSLPKLDFSDCVKLKIKKGVDYMKEKSIKKIDFLKIDTEGFDFEVIKGFGEKIKDIQIIQFEYGGTSLDKNGFNLNDIIKYLENYGFYDFSYLHNNGHTKIEDLKGKTCDTYAGCRNGQLASLPYPETVEYMQEDGFIPDHYNYCNIVCINAKSL